MTEDEKLIRAKLRFQRFERWMRAILLVLAAATFCVLISSLIWTTWIK